MGVKNVMVIKYSLLENGFDFLIYAINDLNIAREDTTDEEARKRLTKYALLHLASGIELVIKYRLLKENWAYIFADMNKANKRDFEDGDFKSVDSATNIERLKNLCGISLSKYEERTLVALRKKRNKIEHFMIQDTLKAVEVIMCDSLSLILNFIAKHINLSSISCEESDHLDKIKRETLNLEEVVAERENLIELDVKKDGIFEQLMTCPECLKKYLFSNDCENHCLFCYYSDTPENVADAYISNVLGISSYLCVKDGEEYPLYECFECAENSMIFDQDKEEYFCFNCGLPTDSLHIGRCADCGQPFYDNEEMSLCSSCFDYRVSKDD